MVFVTITTTPVPREYTKNRRSFVSDEALQKVLCLATQKAGTLGQVYTLILLALYCYYRVGTASLYYILFLYFRGLTVFATKKRDRATRGQHATNSTTCENPLARRYSPFSKRPNQRTTTNSIRLVECQRAYIFIASAEVCGTRRRSRS